MESLAGSSSRVLPTNPSSLTHENLQHYLVDDDLGKRLKLKYTEIWNIFIPLVFLIRVLE